MTGSQTFQLHRGDNEIDHEGGTISVYAQYKSSMTKGQTLQLHRDENTINLDEGAMSVYA